MHREPVGIDEAEPGIALDGRQAFQMLLLGGTLDFVQPVVHVPRGTVRHRDDQHLAVIEAQPGFPLGVRKGRRVDAQERCQHRQALGEVGVAVANDPDGRGLRQCAGHVPHQVDHRVALPDVLVQHVQGFGAGDDEVLLHLDRDVRPVKVSAQGVAVAAELRADGGQEDLYVRHGRPLPRNYSTMMSALP